MPEAATDVTKAGHSWVPRIVNPTLWSSPSDPYTAVEPLLPHGYAFNDDTHKVGFQETRDNDSSAESDTSALALARRRQHARQGTREFVRGKAGSMPFMPGGAEWSTAGNPAAAAAAQEASTGAWLHTLESFCAAKESGNSQSVGTVAPKALAPGMPRGAFGAWQASLEEEELAAELLGLGLENNNRQLQDGSATGGHQQDEKESSTGRKEKVALDDLFAGVWMLEEEEEESSGLIKLEDLDKIEEESIGEEESTQIAAISSSNESGKNTEGVLAEVSSAVLLPGDLDLPGGVESSIQTEDLAVILASQGESSSSTGDWARRPAAPDSLFAAISGTGKSKKYSERSTWAVRGTVKNLATQWKALQPGLAKHYPFELDIFQKEAILHMEAGHSVFVAAHTSAGKTVAAEYAFALASKHCTRAVYTSPIKTISNQKFRDFTGQFEVGLLTGDVSIKPDSSCLIMTTEILRSMLYKGADIIRDIEWVIFDEVHYVNDIERGVVWEEVIIMLPEHVNLVLLSATVPNVMEFADWVGRTKRKVVHVTGTMKRPVPLEHSIYYGGKLFTVCTAEVYDPRGFRQAREAHTKKNSTPQTKAEAKAALPTGRGDGGGGRRGGAAGSGRGGSSRGGGGQKRSGAPGGGGGGGMQLRGERSQWGELIAHLKKQELLPMVAFCFSKKRCDALADSLSSFDMTTASEKSEIHVFCDRALARLKGTDRELPQVLSVREMLKRGLGVHHAGLLPIVKEVVEMLFCRGVIKVLFSTETFAMGVNAPARSVVFQALRKHDGKQFRTLLPGEYTQMAGRAGRRGLDPVGTVIIAAWDDLPEETDIRRLLTGAATKLESQFRLTYSMILNLLRVEDLKVEDMLKRSFAEFHSQRAAPEVQAALQKGQDALRRLRARPWPASPLGTTREEVEEYASVAIAGEALGQEVQESVITSRGASGALVNGRVVLVIRRTTGVTELGVVLDPSSEIGFGGSGGGGGKKKGGGVSLSLSSSFPGSDSMPGSNNGGSASDGSSGGRKRIVLSLFRPSPLDDQVAKEGGSGSFSNGANLPASSSSTGGMRLMKKDDDDLFLGMKALGGKGKGGGGGGGGFRGAAAKPPLPLPHRGAVGGSEYLLAEVPSSDIIGICKVKIRVEAEGVVVGDNAALAAAINALTQVQENAAGEGGTPPLMDPISDLKINSLEIAGAVRERQRLLTYLATLPPHRDPFLPEMMAVIRSEQMLTRRLSNLAKQSGDAGLAQLPEFHQRVAVLQQMGYLDSDRTVTMKGRVACEINSGDELVATELIFGGVLTELTPEEAVSLLSALVFQEKSDSDPELPARLVAARNEAAALAYSAGIVQKEAGLDIVPEDFVLSTLKFGLMEVVYEWANGTPFSEICGLTDVMEGSIVRAIVRLDETCREFRDAARVMGNTALYQQMEAASACIKRDIVFAASLYVS